MTDDTTIDNRDPFTRQIIGAAIEVHREMGSGLLESVYQAYMEQELRLRGISFIQQAPIPIVYKGVRVADDLAMDLFFPEKLVVELKAVDALSPIHEAKLLTYLRLSGTHAGLLINFNVRLLRDGIKRMVL